MSKNTETVAGIRLTPLRKQVYDALSASDRPLSAYELLDRLRPAGIKSPPPVYRSLNFLVEHGLVHRIESLNAFMACRHPHDHEHGVQLLICDDCGRTEEVEVARLSDDINSACDDHGFEITHPVVEIHGRCRQCRQSACHRSTVTGS